jgi:indole-3-glycerol phosphate synthase
MKDILEEIIINKVKEVEQWQSLLSMRRMYELTQPMLQTPVVSMKEALLSSDTGIIAEFKRKSPSKGWINKDARAGIVPRSYQDNGAASLSILTDIKYFGGYDEFIQEARATDVTIPILYKNFIIDEYQLLQARHSGASAVLLIAAALEKNRCKELMEAAHQLGLEVLLEIHSEDELEYMELEPEMCGVNNRHLGTFVTDVNHSFRLAELLPLDVVKVSESGISDPDTVKALRQVGFRGFLMGECFMKNADPGAALKNFIDNIKGHSYDS